ncbi:uncharacterized protein LOC144014729 isoform X2 [Festucalex cinctus]
MKAVTYRPNMYTHTLSVKSDDEIYALLNDMGIKHGPVVDSTRSLYEKKIVEAMAKWKKALRTRPDKTYYREEEKVTYFYRTPERFTRKQTLHLRFSVPIQKLPAERKTQEIFSRCSQKSSVVQLHPSLGAVGVLPHRSSLPLPRHLQH